MRNRYTFEPAAGTQELCDWFWKQGLDPRDIPTQGTYVEEQSDGTWVLSYAPFIRDEEGKKIRLDHPTREHTFRRGPLAVQLVSAPPDKLLR